MNTGLLEDGDGPQVRGGAGLFKFRQEIVHTEEGAAFMRWTQEHSCGVPRLYRGAHICGMSSAGSAKLQIAGEIRAWMLGILEETGMSAREWATKARIAASTVQRAIKDDYEFVTSSQTLAKLAAAANVDPPNVTKRSPPTLVRLPVRHDVQAGAWFEYDPHRPENFEMKAAIPDPDVPIEEQWLEKVHGDSMNLLIPDGAHVVVISAFGYDPVNGQIVIVERSRNGGQLRERSIKQVVKRPGGKTELWPRSTDPKHQSPIILDEPDDETVVVEIVGRVVGYHMDFPR